MRKGIFMKHFLDKIRQNKLTSKPGIIDKVLPLLICLVVVTVMIHVFIGWTDTIKVKRDADTLVREYLLIMEAEGYLTVENKEKLLQELNDIGVEVSNWGDTSFSNVGYGNEVILEVNGTTQSRLKIINSWNSISNDNSNFTVSLRKTSTAKN